MKETFIVRTEWFEAIKELEPIDQATIFQNLFYFHIGEESKIILNNLSVKLVWKFIEPNLKRNIDNYDKRKETSSLNGKLGGRPTEIILDLNGIEIPKYKEGNHFIYLIYDSDLNLHKIGETSDLLKRRLSIKRPTRFIDIVNFAINTAYICQFTEKQILHKFKSNIVNGDWLLLNSADLIDVNRIINLNKPNNKPNETQEPIETLSVSVSVSDSVIVSDIINKNKEQISDEILNARIFELEQENLLLKEKKEKEKNSAKKEKDKNFDFRQALINEGVDEVVANDFMLVRKGKKAPSTETAFKLILNECEVNQFPLNEAIKTCINKNWQSFKYEWYVNLNINQNARISSTSESKSASNNEIAKALGIDNNRQEGKPLFRFINPANVPSFGYVGQEQEV